MAKDKTKLTAKQKRFVEEYAADPVGVQAYFRAFGRHTSKGKKRSYKAAQVQASRLLENPIIAQEIKAASDAYASRLRVTKQRALREIASLAFQDPDDVFESDPDNSGRPIVRPWQDIPPAARRSISGMKFKRKRIAGGRDSPGWEVEEIDVKFHSKDSALEKLCKRLGFYMDAGDIKELVALAMEQSKQIAALERKLRESGHNPPPIPGTSTVAPPV